MDDIHWPLSVLSRAIQYKNLTGASQHIGLSQPQLSRLINKLEADLNLTLLDRTSPRNTTWTPVARQLAEIYSKSSRTLSHAISELQDNRPSHISIGTLEGLSTLAIDFSAQLFESSSVSYLHLDVYDLNELEAKFLSGELDLIFSSRSPGKKKFKFQKTLGHQGFESFDHESVYRVFSPYEYDQKKGPRPPEGEKFIISNSLYIRRDWILQRKARGRLPGAVSRTPSKTHTQVVVLANDYLNPSLWALAEKI